jgi:hypothetical protein
MRNGTFKRTQHNRFAALEKAFSKSIARRAHRIRQVLDLAVSSGVTTVDFAEYLSGLGARFNMVATDAFISAHIVEFGAGIRILAAPDGFPLQYDIRGVAFRPWVRRLDYATLGILPRLALRASAERRAARLIAAGRSVPVQLVSPRLAMRPDIRLVEADIRERQDSFCRRFDLIRAANILNRGAFADADLQRAIRHVASYLAGPGALLIVTRTGPDGRDNGTLFVQSDHGIEILSRHGTGSEIEREVQAGANPGLLSELEHEDCSRAQ